MKKDDGERVAVLETKVDRLEKEHESWKEFVKRVIIQSFFWLLGIVVGGNILGWHIMPVEVRKALADWISK